ncbi:ribonuclease M5 [Jeotgalibacillus proteolyticus]|uniref:Ribonuclease M5 n=1 Tax=Jeotgalibacillus proteolyticus TaxID=2082395 RepID=A0A2S5G6B6_9BACL|nr:ribonuclease M5 [Jeotgalibacillus proteolyticus]PPA68520.1 ribonuclease M5 [Jeotgalibacillus proteolyticus]
MKESAKIKEVVIVEGRDDTTAIKRAVNADTIETNGSAVPKMVLEKIRHAHEKRGVIVLTDPDYPGQRIRQIVQEYVPGCMHAFINREDALRKHGRGIGVEHASPEVIREALKHAHTMAEEPQEIISKEELIEAGLIGGPKAKARRELLGARLNIGYSNGKQLYNRLVQFEISREEFIREMSRILQEEQHD